MNNTFKRAAAILLAAGIAAGMTACGNAPAAPADGAGTDAAKPAESKAAPADGAGAATGETKEIKVIMTVDWEKTVAKFIQEAMQTKGFSEANPDITLTFEHVPFADLDKKIITSHVGGVYYDLIQTNHPSVGVFADGGILQPLDEYMVKSGINKEQYNQSFLSSAFYKGVQYAMPLETDCRVLGLNEELLKAEGLELPKTKEDMVEIVKKTTKDIDGDGKNDQYGMVYHFQNMWFPTYDLGQWLLGNGGSLYTEKDGKYTATIDSPEALDFMNWSAQMIPYQPTDFISFDGTQINSLIADNKVAMFVSGPWNYSDPIFLDKGFTFKAIINPVGSKTSGSSMGGWHLGMGSQSKNKDAVWTLLEWLATPEISAITAGALTPIYDAYNFAPFNDPKYDVFKEQLKTATLPAPAIPELTEIAELWNKQYQAAMLGEKTNEAALKDAQAEIQAVLDKKK